MPGLDEEPLAAASDLIRDGNEATFMADVIEASDKVPVIVDFWAPWCGPCKQLGPALEAAVTAAKGRVRLVKINIDENQMIAAQMRIQSIPTVYAFWKGQPADGFQGALPGSEIRKFIDGVAALAGDGGTAEALAAAEELMEQGAVADAAAMFASILSEEPENAAAYGGLARAHVAAGNLDQAEAILNATPAAIATAKEVEAARAGLLLARQASDAGPVAELRATVNAEPANNAARYDLAVALNAAGATEEAIDELIELFRRDRDWNDGAAKQQLFTIFDSLRPDDPLVRKGRRRLSSLIFT